MQNLGVYAREDFGFPQQRQSPLKTCIFSGDFRLYVLIMKLEGSQHQNVHQAFLGMRSSVVLTNCQYFSTLGM